MSSLAEARRSACQRSAQIGVLCGADARRACRRSATDRRLRVSLLSVHVLHDIWMMSLGRGRNPSTLMAMTGGSHGGASAHPRDVEEQARQTLSQMAKICILRLYGTRGAGFRSGLIWSRAGPGLGCLRNTIKPKECVEIWYIMPILTHVLMCLLPCCDLHLFVY